MDTFTAIAAPTVVVLGALSGVALTFLTLPGIWLMVVIALLCEWWSPGLVGWWTLAATAGVAVLAEVAEFLASAAGAGRAGGSRWGAAGSIVGSLAGALAGTPFLPPIGPIVGAILGAGAGTLVAELAIARRPLGESSKSAAGATIGRALSVVVKGSISVVAAGVLLAGMFLF